MTLCLPAGFGPSEVGEPPVGTVIEVHIPDQHGVTAWYRGKVLLHDAQGTAPARVFVAFQWCLGCFYGVSVDESS